MRSGDEPGFSADHKVTLHTEGAAMAAALISEEALRAYVIAALRTLEAQAREKPIPTMIEQGIDFTHPTAPIQPLWEVPLRRSFVSSARHLLKALPEAEAVRASLLDEGTLHFPSMTDAENRPVKPSVQQRKDRVDELMLVFLGGYFEHYKTLAFSEDRYQEHRSNFRAVWQSTNVVHLVTVPLLSFSSTKETIVIDEDLTLTELSAQTKITLWRPFGVVDLPKASANELYAAKFALVGRYTTSSPIESIHGELIERMRAALTALRLLKPGSVFGGPLYDRLEHHHLATSAAGGSFADGEHRPRRRREYRLESGDINRLLNIYRALTHHRAVRQSLAVCLSRFQQTYVRESQEDQIIDLTIALESTLLADVREELGYRLALRGSRLLSGQLERKYSFTLLRTLYEARSKIVHEGKSLQAQAKKGLIGGMPIDQFLGEATEWVRMAVREYLRRVAGGQLLKAIAADLDDAILAGS